MSGAYSHRINLPGAGVYQSVGDTSFVGFLEWIRSERLTTLPHKGSRWDRVLIRALFFAEQLHKFDMAIQGFALDSNAAACLGYGHARLLLEVRCTNVSLLCLTTNIHSLGRTTQRRSIAPFLSFTSSHCRFLPSCIDPNCLLQHPMSASSYV